LGVPYSVYLYVGLLPWVFFTNSLTSSTRALVDNSSLLKQIYFPREILVLSILLAKVFDFLLSILIFILLILWFKIPLSLATFLFIPIFFIQLIFTFSLSLFLSVLNLFYRDIQYLLNLVITLWFYITPVLYATEFFPEKYRWIFKINPMSVFINAYRQVVLTGKLPNLSSLAIGILISVIIFIIAYRFFKRLEGIFADIV